MQKVLLIKAVKVTTWSQTLCEKAFPKMFKSIFLEQLIIYKNLVQELKNIKDYVSQRKISLRCPYQCFLEKNFPEMSVSMICFENNCFERKKSPDISDLRFEKNYPKILKKSPEKNELCCALCTLSKLPLGFRTCGKGKYEN